MKEWGICGRCNQMCRETLFSWRPLLSLCCGLLVGFILVQDDIIVRAEGRKYCIQTPHAWISDHKVLLLNSKRLQIKCGTFLQLCYSRWGLFLVMGVIFILADIWMCERCLVCLFACRSWTRLCLHATLYQQPRDGKPQTEKQEQEKHK